MAIGAILAARWLHQPQLISNLLVGWGFDIARGGIDSTQAISVFVRGLLEL